MFYFVEILIGTIDVEKWLEINKPYFFSNLTHHYKNVALFLFLVYDVIKNNMF